MDNKNQRVLSLPSNQQARQLNNQDLGAQISSMIQEEIKSKKTTSVTEILPFINYEHMTANKKNRKRSASKQSPSSLYSQKFLTFTFTLTLIYTGPFTFAFALTE